MARSKAMTVLRNARIFTSTSEADSLKPGCIVLDGETLFYVGPEDAQEVREALSTGATLIDMAGDVLTPSFIDSHVHVMHFGQSLSKLDVLPCKSLEEIRARIKAFAAAHPAEPRILCKGWLQSTVDGQAVSSMLDDLDPRPIYVEAMDLHSVWCNTAALDESGIMKMKRDPAGGKIHRDTDGRPSGLLEESALLAVIVPFLFDSLTEQDKQDLLHKAFTSFTTAGYTGCIDMAMDTDQWKALLQYRDSTRLPLHVAAHWLVPYSDDDTEIQRDLDEAIRMHEQYHPSRSPSFCVVGIKIIGDGTVDGCTAALTHPYGALEDPCEPIWPYEKLAALVKKADSAGLQCAIHAIGDRTIREAVDAIAALGKPNRRHRIEHLELASAEDARRLGQLGIIASVQPVHSDPVLFRAWPSLIGEHRCKRGFAYKEFLDGGAPVAFGTDTPTAPHYPLCNLYNATTRKSALEPECEERTNPQFAVELTTAIKAATAGAAYSRYAESWTGTLQKGMSADFVVMDTDWTPAGLLASKVKQTWFRGEKVFDESQS
jgi:predicted amidohydrolase YtcJ